MLRSFFHANYDFFCEQVIRFFKHGNLANKKPLYLLEGVAPFVCLLVTLISMWLNFDLFLIHSDGWQRNEGQAGKTGASLLADELIWKSTRNRFQNSAELSFSSSKIMLYSPCYYFVMKMSGFLIRKQILKYNLTEIYSKNNWRNPRKLEQLNVSSDAYYTLSI